MGVFLLPGIESGFANPQVSAQIADERAAFGLTDCIDDLLIGISRPLHEADSFRKNQRSGHSTLALNGSRFQAEMSMRHPRKEENFLLRIMFAGSEAALAA